jgi:hypothetical protein
MIIQTLAEKGEAAFRARYPWFRSGSFKVASYRSQLDDIAEKLSEMRSCEVKTRFNRPARRAELYDGNEVLLSIEVRGGVYFDGDMYVRGKLSREEQMLFTKIPLQMHFSSA